MIPLLLSSAIELVRKNLEELDPNGSIMYQDENGSSADFGDNSSLDNIISRCLPEAINAVNLAAPTMLLEGKEYEFSGQDDVSISEDGVLSITLVEQSAFLRLVAFKAADSSIVVTDVLAEASPEGHKQLNKYIRGNASRPRLVQLQGKHTGPSFKYYSITNPSEYTNGTSVALTEGQPSVIDVFSFVEEQFYPAQVVNNEALGYQIPRRLRQNIIDCLTAMVLETYSDQRAQAFYQKANNFPKI